MEGENDAEYSTPEGDDYLFPISEVAPKDAPGMPDALHQ
jgi:hypothetical protein